MATLKRGDNGEWNVSYGSDDRASVDAILAQAQSDPTFAQALESGRSFRITGANGGNPAITRAGEGGGTVWRAGNWGTRGYGTGDGLVTRNGQQYNRIGSFGGDQLAGKQFQGRPFTDYLLEDPEFGTLIRSDALAEAGKYNPRDIGDYLPGVLMGLAGGLPALQGAPSLFQSLGQGLGLLEGGLPAGMTGAEIAGLREGAPAMFESIMNPPGAESSVMGWEQTLPGTYVDTVPGGTGGALPTSMEASGLAGGSFTPPGFGPDISGSNIFGTGGLGAAGGALPSIMDTVPGAGVAAGAGGLFGQLGASAAGTAASKALTGSKPSASSPADTVSQYLKELGIDISPGALGLIGTGLSTGLGVLGANQQDKALQSVVDAQKAVTQPFITDALDMLRNPEGFYKRPEVTGAIDASLRGLSSKVGNPINNPGAIAQQAAYNTGLYNQALNTRLATALGGQDTLNRLQTTQALNSGNQLNAIGAGLGSMLSTAPNINNLLAQYLLGKG